MSCYLEDLPNLDKLFAALGWEDTPSNRDKLDTAIREFLGFVPQESTCEQVRKEIKNNLDDPSFINTLFDVLKDSLSGTGGETEDEEM